MFSKGAKVKLHDQRPPRDRDLSLRDYILSGAPELVAIEQELASLEEAMAQGAHDEATLGRYAEAQAALEHAGGYAWRDRALATLHGLGFRDDADLDRSLDTFSGGELTRASLGRALAGTPDLLLLDEPTNHLDIESLEWLETHLISLDAAIVLVAHDRWFLESVGTSVLELEAGRGKFFSGTWHQWRKEKAARELALGRAIERQEAEIERLERFVTRFRAGTRARQAQSRVKKLSKIQRLSADPTDGAALQFAFKPPERSGRVVFELEHAELSAGGKELLHDAELWLERGEHVSLVGANGTGKTTLIETLAGQRELPAGKLLTGHNVKVGYLSQHAEELNAGTARTVLEAAQRASRADPGQGARPARAVPVLRRGRREAAGRPLRRRAPAAVAGRARPLRGQRAHPGRADQPPGPREPRGAGRRRCGSSRARCCSSPTTGRCWTPSGRAPSPWRTRSCTATSAGWPEYLRVREERAKAPRRPRPRPRPPVRRRRARRTAPRPGGSGAEEAQPAQGQGRGGVRPAWRPRSRAAEAALRAVEDELADPAAWATPEATARSTARHEEAKLRVAELYERWEAVAG